MKKIILLILATFLISILSYGVEADSNYDGLWFLGFNLHKDLFLGEKGRLVRKAFNKSIKVEKITKEIIGDNVVPTGVIPTGMLGYDPELKGYSYDIKWGRDLMKEAGYKMTDPRIKEIYLLHTDGDKTRLIARQIMNDLSDIGVRVLLKEIKYTDQDAWEAGLESGIYHLFLMGYKAGTIGDIFVGDKKTKLFYPKNSPNIPEEEKNREIFLNYPEAIKAGYRPSPETEEVPEIPDTLSLLRPLFRGKGDANFTFYQNERVDALMDQLEIMDRTDLKAYEAKLKTIGRIIREDAPTVNLFYIKKI